MENAETTVTEIVLVKPADILALFEKYGELNIDTRESDKAIAEAVELLGEMEVGNDSDFEKMDEAQGVLKKLVKHLETKEIGPLRDAFHKGHKDIVATTNDKTQPAKEAIATAVIKMDAYEDEQKRLALIEEARVREVQRKEQEAERKRLQDIADAEAQERQEKLRKEADERAIKNAELAQAAGNDAEVEAIIAAPVEVETVAPVHVPAVAPQSAHVAPPTPRRKGKLTTWSSRPTNGKGKITLKEFLSLEPSLQARLWGFLTHDDVKIGKHVKMHKEDACKDGEQEIPGIEAYIK